MVTTGGEVKKGLIEDAFTPVVIRKLAAYGIETIAQTQSGDGVDNVAAAIADMRARHPDILLCTGGMSVDPDDNTPGGIRKSGADIVAYGAPVLPGAMFLLGYYDDGTPVCGLPGCVMFAGATVFDLILPRLAAGVDLPDIIKVGNDQTMTYCGAGLFYDMTDLVNEIGYGVKHWTTQPGWEGLIDQMTATDGRIP